MQILEGRNRIACIHRSRNQNSKFRKFEMANGRHFENGYIAKSRPHFIQFRWHLAIWRRFWFREWSCGNNQNFTNPTLADGCLP